MLFLDGIYLHNSNNVGFGLLLNAVHTLNIETNFDIFKTKLKEAYELSLKLVKGDANTKPLLELEMIIFKLELALEVVGE